MSTLHSESANAIGAYRAIPRNRTVLFIVIPLFGLLATGMGFQDAQAPPHEHNSIASYLEALPAIETAYSQFRIRGVATLEQNIGEPDYRKTSNELELLRTRSGLMQSIETFEPPPQEPTEGSSPTRLSVVSLNGDYGFMLNQKHGSRDFTLSNFAPANQSIRIKNAIDIKGRLIVSLYAFTVTAGIRDVITSLERHAPSNSKPIERDGKSLVKFEFPISDETIVKGLPLHLNSLTVSPSEGWALYEAVTTFGDPPKASVNTLTVEYEGEKNGMPLPKRIVDQRGAKTKHVFDVKEIDFDELPKERFYLSHFGLPEPGGPTEQGSWNRAYLLILGLAFLALIAAIGSKWLGNRSAPSV